jgi:hypothetical protein
MRFATCLNAVHDRVAEKNSFTSAPERMVMPMKDVCGNSRFSLSASGPRLRRS